jgi:hypothetical protein
MASFVRVQEELLVMRKESAVGAARDRIDAMLKLNSETLETMRRGLVLTKKELSRLNAPEG